MLKKYLDFYEIPKIIQEKFWNFVKSELFVNKILYEIKSNSLPKNITECIRFTNECVDKEKIEKENIYNIKFVIDIDNEDYNYYFLCIIAISEIDEYIEYLKLVDKIKLNFDIAKQFDNIIKDLENEINKLISNVENLNDDIARIIMTEYRIIQKEIEDLKIKKNKIINKLNRLKENCECYQKKLNKIII